MVLIAFSISSLFALTFSVFSLPSLPFCLEPTKIPAVFKYKASFKIQLELPIIKSAFLTKL